MIFVICVLVGIGLGIWYNVKDWGFDSDTIGSAFLGGLIGLIAALLIWLVVVLCPFQTAVAESHTTNISALADNARYEGRVSGSVFLVQSRVDEKLKYSYMYEAEGKGYGFKEVPAATCYINYTDGQAYVRCDSYDYKSGFMRWLFPNIFGSEYIFYIPESAQVIDDFTIDFN